MTRVQTCALRSVFAEKRAQAEEVHREPGDTADRFLRRRPAGTDASVLADLGAAKLREGRLAMARRYLLAALEADGDNLAALVHLGLLLEQEDRRQEALARFEQALELPLPEAAAGPAVQTALELRNAAALHLKGLQARRSR